LCVFMIIDQHEAILKDLSAYAQANNAVRTHY